MLDSTLCKPLQVISKLRSKDLCRYIPYKSWNKRFQSGLFPIKYFQPQFTISRNLKILIARTRSHDLNEPIVILKLHCLSQLRVKIFFIVSGPVCYPFYLPNLAYLINFDSDSIRKYCFDGNGRLSCPQLPDQVMRLQTQWPTLEKGRGRFNCLWDAAFTSRWKILQAGPIWPAEV